MSDTYRAESYRDTDRPARADRRRGHRTGRHTARQALRAGRVPEPVATHRAGLDIL